jgi:bifunctional ADP-heptose synthase (sugar kinase/adenylyltransferase)
MSFDDVKSMVDSFSKLKVLVVGDIIIDDYVFCNVQGLMSKDQSLSSRFIREERYLGGSLAVARHLASFAGSVTVCSMVGQDERLHSQMLSELGSDMLLDLSATTTYKTPIKRRFIQKSGNRDDYHKLFSVNHLLDRQQYVDVERCNFYSKIKKNIAQYDAVFVTDYGHGLIDERCIDILQNKAKCLVINCQTNSSNVGENIITKYNRADAFTLDERELKQAYHFLPNNYYEPLSALYGHLKASSGWLTLGSYGSLHLDQTGKPVRTPALTLNIVDTVGASDAFFALAGLAASMRSDPQIGALLGNISGALAANYIGNSDAISKTWLLKSLQSFMSF